MRAGAEPAWGQGGLSPPTPKTPLEAKKVLGFRDGGQGRSGFRDSGQVSSGEATSFGGDAHIGRGKEEDEEGKGLKPPLTPRIKIIQRGSSPPLLLVLPSTP